ncbi:MAG: DUF4352 domain-containing protein [Desulfurococcaceae archaeon]
MKAISPVIATVIIVAVTIAITIAVALWMTGIIGGFTGTENLQIINAYVNSSNFINEGYITIVLDVKNVGTVDATIDNIFFNGRSCTGFTITTDGTIIIDETTASSVSIPIKVGESKTLIINLTLMNCQGNVCQFCGFNIGPGQMLEIKLHTASGKEYPKMITVY